MYAPPTTLLTLVARCTVTGIANKLKLAGFATHQIGKWDAGMGTAHPHSGCVELCALAAAADALAGQEWP